jgi:hypothetical protein
VHGEAAVVPRRVTRVTELAKILFMPLIYVEFMLLNRLCVKLLGSARVFGDRASFHSSY